MRYRHSAMNAKTNGPPSKGDGGGGYQCDYVDDDGGGNKYDMVEYRQKQIGKQRSTLQQKQKHIAKRNAKTKLQLFFNGCCRLWVGICFGLCCIIGHTWAGFACLSNPCVFGVCIDDINRWVYVFFSENFLIIIL